MTKRCDWCGSDPLYQDYHDNVWGRPLADDRDLFAKLCLDGQQAGLSWLIILRKQPAYYRAFSDFCPEKLVHYTASDIGKCLADPGIVRNRLKVASIVQNARAFLAMESRGEPFGEFLWSFVEGRPRINAWRKPDDVPVHSPESIALSKALKKRGFTFVGPTICYAFMQATGLVMDHLTSCHCYENCRRLAEDFAVGHPTITNEPKKMS
jgi:DNA-3-methyladenine glycosylase I